MADAVTNRTIYDGPRHCAVLLTNISDGSGETAVLKVDVSGLNANQGKTCTGVNVRRIQFCTFGMAVSLLWDASTDVAFASLQGNGTIDFEPFGGLSNNAGSGVTGDILLTTAGASSGDTYMVLLELEKVY